jgi:hypothetical protein
LLRPIHSSTPTRNEGTTKITSPLKSIKSKLCRLSNVIHSVKPDVKIGTETWLNADIKDPESCPDGFRLHRKDRSASGGGGGGGRVLIAVKSEYNSETVHDLDSNCEVVWAKFSLKGNGTVYIGSYYRRHMSHGESLEQLETSLHRASSIRNASVIIGGDFNLPGWDWRSMTLKPNATYPNLNQQFLDIINNNGLAQIVEDPTRLDNTLDLILTCLTAPVKFSKPTLYQESQILTLFIPNLTLGLSYTDKNHAAFLYVTKLTGTPSD